MKMTRVFFGVHMGQAFQGLTTIVKESKTTLTPDSNIVFINRKMTAFKVLRGKDYLVYYNNGKHQIPLDALKFLPQQFGGSKFEVDKMIEKSLRTKLGLPTL